jgi:hypothetical protein
LYDLHQSFVRAPNGLSSNDSFFITTYKNRLKLQSVLALCFAEYHETYFHWKLYAGDACGICIEFDKDLLLSNLNCFTGIRFGYVRYKKLDELKGIELDQLPFTKRYGFSEENEFRILYEDKDNKFSRKDIPIDINCIRRVIFNPWIPQHVYKSNRDIIKKMCEVKQLNIIKSTINNNKTWKKWGSEIANPRN